MQSWIYPLSPRHHIFGLFSSNSCFHRHPSLTIIARTSLAESAQIFGPSLSCIDGWAMRSNPQTHSIGMDIQRALWMENEQIIHPKYPHSLCISGTDTTTGTSLDILGTNGVATDCPLERSRRCRWSRASSPSWPQSKHCKIWRWKDIKIARIIRAKYGILYLSNE